VSLASARAMYLRLSAASGTVTPRTTIALGEPGLRRLGLTRQKAAYAVELAARIEDGRLPISRLHRLSDDAARGRLMEVPGIGTWTASIYLLMALRRPDIWPRGDLALHKAMARLEALPEVPSAEAADVLAARWRPLRAVAARILWHGYLSDART
jgi:DNA-3-methyladenine glycosylase II